LIISKLINIIETNVRLTSLDQNHKKSVSPHGPTTFDLRTILQKRDNLRANSNKFMHETTDSQDLKLEKGR